MVSKAVKVSVILVSVFSVLLVIAFFIFHRYKAEDAMAPYLGNEYCQTRIDELYTEFLKKAGLTKVQQNIAAVAKPCLTLIKKDGEIYEITVTTAGQKYTREFKFGEPFQPHTKKPNSTYTITKKGKVLNLIIERTDDKTVDAELDFGDEELKIKGVCDNVSTTVLAIKRDE